MLGGAGTKNLFSLKKLEWNWIRKVLDEAEMKGFLSINMLGGAGTKKLNLLKMLEGAVIKKLL